MEEILLQHRALIDAAVESLEETTPIDGFLRDLESSVADLRVREPACWELRVVDYIHNAIQSELSSCLRSGGAAIADVDRVKEGIRTQLSAQLDRLHGLLETPEDPVNEKHQEHLVASLWSYVESIVTLEVNVGAEVDPVEDDSMAEHASFEAITFDELQFETGSVNSAPSAEEIPMILENLQSPSHEERHAALERLLHIPPIELVHCSMHFRPVTQSLCGLLLDPDRAISQSALQLLYTTIGHIEDPAQFLDLYIVVVDWVGKSMSAATLAIGTTDVFSDNEAIIAAVEAFRLFHLVICRVPYHWIHFSSEMLARVICATLVVLLLDPSVESHKVCRPLDVLGVIDQEAKWFSKWMLRVPSRAQMFASLDETGFLSALMYDMTRIRPFETEVEPFDRSRTLNTLTILASAAPFNAGRALLRSWTKLPAHVQLQRRFTAWLGIDKHFRLDPASDENELLYTFSRLDCTIKSARGTELEDGEPLGDQAMTAIALSTILIYLLNSSSTDSIRTCLTASCRNIALLSSSNEVLTKICEMIVKCGLDRSGGTITATSGANELETQDPWFPFRRPKTIDVVAKLAVDSATKRGLLPSPSLTHRCAHIFASLAASAATLSFVTLKQATALAVGLQGYFDNMLKNPLGEDSRDNLSQVSSVLVSLREMLEKSLSPSTLGRAFTNTRLSAQLVDIAEFTSGRDSQDAVFGFVLTLTHASSLVPELVASGLWKQCLLHYLERWRSFGEIDIRTMQLLLLPSATSLFFQSGGVEKMLDTIEYTCAVDLDIALAISSDPSEAPIHLRPLFHTLATARAALGSQFAGSIFTMVDAPLYKFFARSVQHHRQGDCRPNPESEDMCAIAYELLTATAGCIPSMVGFFELLGHCDTRSLLPGEDDSISACSWLAMSMSSSLTHVGGHPSHWFRPRPLHAFSNAEAHLVEETAESNRGATPSTYSFTTTTICAINQMMASIEESKQQRVPLDMVMLSQATWEILADIEKVTSCDTHRYRTLTDAFGKLIFALAMSGQSKIAVDRTAPRLEAVNTAARFPSDAERKLMNTYYKDYCARLGLKATPTMLHVLSKLFGKAAMDCFACTALMILDQTHSENQTIEFLEYCAGCPSMYALWPRIAEATDLPVLLPVAQAAELILEVEFPQIFTTLRQCHCSVSTLVLRWHSQFYWNYLTWDNILIMVYLSFLYGAEFQVYFFVAIAKHFEPTMRAIIARNSGDPARAFVETLQTPIEGFRFHTLRNFFLTLRSTYHDQVYDMLRQ